MTTPANAPGFSSAPSANESRPKILVGVCSCRTYGDKRQAIRETWLSNPIDDLECRFFVGNGDPLPEEPDTVVLPADDGYAFLPAKVRSFFAHALETSDFDWLFKCDDDTYVALDRLHELLDDRHGIIGSEYLAQRGSPSGGAGYLLSREIVRKLAGDGSLPLTGCEDVILGEAAIRHGAQPLPSARLRMDASRYPQPENDLVTAHWCSPDRLRAIHGGFLEEIKREIVVEHPSWQDRVSLFANGFFRRNGSGCSGAWEEDGAGALALKWFDWPEEVFLPESTDSGPAAIYRLKPKPPSSTVPGTAPAGSVLFHLGCGPNHLPGWNNLDLPGIDIRRDLPWQNDSADALFLEHVIEHISPPEAYRFMIEAMRVLKPGGILRLAFPDVIRIEKLTTPEYRRFLAMAGWGDGGPGSEIASIVTNHGHLGVWSEETMSVLLRSIGFRVKVERPGESSIPHLRGLEHHGSQIGEAFNSIETCCLEAWKPGWTPVPGQEKTDTLAVFLTNPGCGLPHLQRFLQSNPGVRMHVAAGEALEGDARTHAWRNCDRMIRRWWSEQGKHLDFDRAVFLEWDVVFDAPLDEIFPPGDFVARDVHSPDPSHPYFREWVWFGEIGRLPPSLRNHASGVSPLAVIAISRRCLEAIFSHPLADETFAADIFCELRLPTLAAACGYPPEQNPERLENVVYYPIDAEDGRGVWHAVKS